MVVVQASKLNLPQTSPLSSPQVSSLLFDSHSLSLALMLSDSSFSLYPSLSAFSLPSLLPRQTLIPPPSSDATFIHLQNPNPNSTPRVLFLVAAPLLGGAAVLLRFWILLRNTQSFVKARVICNQSGLKFDDNKSGVVFSINHGVSTKLAGSINVFAMYSISSRKIWLFAAKMMDDEDEGVTLKLMKCAEIDCFLPVFAISVSFGFLILGEENGVRVFPLRPLVKGRVKRRGVENRNLNNGLINGKLEGRRLNLPNGSIPTINGAGVSYGGSVIRFNSGVSSHVNKGTGAEGTRQISSNGYLEGKPNKHCDSVKLKAVKLRQDSKEGGSCFVPLKDKEVGSHTKAPLQSVKAISIQAFSPNKFLILDSAGELQLLFLSNPAVSEIPYHVKQLTNTIKVEKLAVLPDISIRTQTVWISDGSHTVHTLAVPDKDTSVCESDGKDEEGKLREISVVQAIFTSEKIEDIVPLAADAILILGQGSLFAYKIS